MATRSDTGWENGFTVTASVVDGTGGVVQRESVIPLLQQTAQTFELGAVTIRYNKRTGLESRCYQGRITPDMIETIREIDSSKLPTTDLASVPGPLRWFTNTYGAYTPAALIHDWLIPSSGQQSPVEGITEEDADRYFRYMLGAVGVPRFKRYIMWTAVAMRTRLQSKIWYRRPLLILWALASLAGITAFVAASSALLFDTYVPGGRPGILMTASLIAPFVCSAMWWRQYAAGIVAALAAPWVLPAAITATLAYGVYSLLEQLNTHVLERFLSEPHDPAAHPTVTSHQSRSIQHPRQAS